MEMMKAVRFTSASATSMIIAMENVPVPKEKEIIIKVAYTAVNRADILQRMGNYPPPAGESDVIGLEASGTVHALGSKAQRWRVGDEVMALLPGGGYAEFAAVNEDHVMPLPPGISLREAGGVPEVWLTAYQLLRLVASVQAGDHVLIHAAASGVGTAALQMLRHWGAVTMATVGSKRKAELCRNFGAQLVVNRKEDSDFHLKVKEFTNERGADIILDCVGGAYWERNAAALAMDGAWVLYGLLGGPEVNGRILGQLLSKRARLLASTLRSRSAEYKAKLVAAFTAELLPHLASDGPLRPVIDREFTLAQAGEAHQYLETNANAGKVILRVGADAPAQEEL